jgi:hypothetical protein
MTALPWGMLYSLSSRELIVDAVDEREDVYNHHFRGDQIFAIYCQLLRQRYLVCTDIRQLMERPRAACHQAHRPAGALATTCPSRQHLGMSCLRVTPQGLQTDRSH